MAGWHGLHEEHWLAPILSCFPLVFQVRMTENLLLNENPCISLDFLSDWRQLNMFLLLLNVTILTSEPLSGVFNLKRVSPSYMDRNFCIWFCFMGLGWRLAALGRGGVGIFTAQRDISQRLIYSWLLLIEIWFGEGWFVPLLFRDHISDSSRLFLFREKKALILLSIELRFFFHLFGLLQYYHRESGHNCWKEQLLLWHYWRYNLCTCRGRGGEVVMF